MQQTKNPRPPTQQELQTALDQVISLRDDPLTFVFAMFPWGTPELPEDGPRVWQIEYLQELTAHLIQQRNNIKAGIPTKPFRCSVRSGRGIGKTALLAWVCIWALLSNPGITIILTANKEDQLKSRTFAEIKRWVTLFLHRYLLDDELALTLQPVAWLKENARRSGVNPGYWYCQGQLWNDKNPSAFAGPHNPVGMIVIMDEASGIPDSIMSVTEGMYTEPTPIRLWMMFSNGRRNVGYFHETHDKPTIDPVTNQPVWRAIEIDSRTVEGLDQSVFTAIIAKYGADSDEARIEVYGKAPKQGDNQLIGPERVKAAFHRDSPPPPYPGAYDQSLDPGAARILTVDVARFGEDESVIKITQGRDARSFPTLVYEKLDAVALATKVKEAIDEWDPDEVIVDGTGVGGGVCDILKSWKYEITEINFGQKADNPERYVDLRAEMWDQTKEWLNTAYLALEHQLLDELTAPTYKYDKQGRLRLKSKDEMKAEGLKSPDRADALVMARHAKVARRDSVNRRRSRKSRMATGLDYDPLAMA